MRFDATAVGAIHESPAETVRYIVRETAGHIFAKANAPRPTVLRHHIRPRALYTFVNYAQNRGGVIVQFGEPKKHS